MAIPQHTIDQILDRTDIVDLIGQRVKLKKTGRTYSGCCPFHQEKSPSFHVYRDKQYYHCFGCQANGNAIRFLMDIDNRNFIDVMKELSSQAGIELPKDNQDNKKLSYKRETVKPHVKPQAQMQEDKNTASKTQEKIPKLLLLLRLTLLKRLASIQTPNISIRHNLIKLDLYKHLKTGIFTTCLKILLNFMNVSYHIVKLHRTTSDIAV